MLLNVSNAKLTIKDKLLSLDWCLATDIGSLSFLISDHQDKWHFQVDFNNNYSVLDIKIIFITHGDKNGSISIHRWSIASGP